MSVPELKEADFVVLKEDYSRVGAHDGTCIKVKMVVRKIFINLRKTPEGYPEGIALDTINAVTALVPPSLTSTPSKEPLDLQKEIGKEISFDEQETNIQEYMLPDGFRITIKPIVTKILKYDKYNNYGEPTYKVFVQGITNIEKITNAN